MASSWGDAWGVSWDNSWGTVGAVATTTAQTRIPGGATAKPRKPAKRPFLYYPLVQEFPELTTVYPFTFAKPKDVQPVIEPQPEPAQPALIFAKPLPFAITSILDRQDAPSVEVEKLKVMARRARARIAGDDANDMNVRLLLLLDY